MLRTIERPDERDLAPVPGRSVEDLLDAMHVRGETGDDHASARLGEHPVEHRLDLALGRARSPGTSALVESTRNRSTPATPSRANARRSVIRPSSGSWSILKSPVCSTTPAAVVIATASASGIEWLTATNSQRERTDLLDLALADLEGVRRDPVLAQLGLDEGAASAASRSAGCPASRAAGMGPRRCGPRARASARSPSTSSSRSRMYSKSGRIRSTPGWWSSGNSTPQSTMSSRPACSKTVMLRPISPIPPSGTTRSPFAGSAGGGPSSGCGWLTGRNRRPGGRPAAARARRRWPPAAAYEEIRHRARPSRSRPALTMIAPWVRVITPVVDRHQPVVDLARLGHLAGEVCLDARGDPVRDQVSGHADDTRPRRPPAAAG